MDSKPRRRFDAVDPADVKGQYMLEAMWMSAITLLTVGYGDVTPYSTCGRLTAVVVGILGVLITALLVAVMAQKLEQSRAEKYLHTFFSRMRLDRLYRHAAAHVIKSIFMLWRLKRLPDGSRKYRRRLLCYGKLMQAVRSMRRLKAKQTHVGESAVGVIEISAAVSDVHRLTEIITNQQSHLTERSDEIEDKLAAIEAARGSFHGRTAPDAYSSPVCIPETLAEQLDDSRTSLTSWVDPGLPAEVIQEINNAEDVAKARKFDIDEVKNMHSSLT
nr:hypothetical protein BaRGS_029291 [Batillaria attramentaria]